MPPGFWAAAAWAIVSASSPAPTAVHRRSVRVIFASWPERRGIGASHSGFPVPGVVAGLPVSRPGGTVAWRQRFCERLSFAYRGSRSAPRADNQERRALALIGKRGLRGALFRARPPLLDRGQGEAEPQQHVEIG